MNIITNTLIGLVAFLHIYFLIFEMFFWDKPYGLKTLGNTLESAKATKVLAMNQGLYNGFLAAGLIRGLCLGEAGYSIKIFFLTCVVIAGVFGGLTASRKILFVQALPAFLALVLILFSF